MLHNIMSAPKIISLEFTYFILLIWAWATGFLLEIKFIFNFESFNLDRIR